MTRHGADQDVRDRRIDEREQSGTVGSPAVWPELIETARAYRIATDYHDWHGRRVEVPVETLIAVLAGFGVDASTPASCRDALRELTDRQFRALPPCVVVRQLPERAGHAAQATAVPRVTVHAPPGSPPVLWIALEDGGRRYDVALLSSTPTERRGLTAYTFALPIALPIGWHTLFARIGGEVKQTSLAVAPHRLTTPTRRRAWGYTLQLHSVRSRRSWGMGDLGDLAELAAIAGHDLGAGFLVVNPLHGSSGVPPVDPSPYLPATRRYPDPIHLRIESVPEYAYVPTEVREQIDQIGAELRKRDLSDDLIDRDDVWEGKALALRLLYSTPRTAGRSAAYRAYLAREGRALRLHATWLTLAQLYGGNSAAWPETLRRPDTDAVAQFAELQQAEIDFHCWLQWLLDEQLAAVRTACAHAGMPYGVFHDLAVGAQADGADTWADLDVYARGVTVGAPADEFNQLGQDWSSRPWRPDRLAETGYLPYRQMLAGVLRHADGVRMDHVMALFRLWWVPAGAKASQGTYVYYDHEELLAVLTLEAHRSGALVIGEDLGTVEPWVREALADRGIFGTNVLWFERDADGSPHPPGRWRENCLAAVTTHDLPPTAALLSGAHLQLRDRLGLLARPLHEEKEADRANVQAWIDLLRGCGLLRAGAGEQETIEALHRFLAWTPARLIGVYLPDAVGDVRPHNLPGTSGEVYPNWRLPLADSGGRPVLLDELAAHPRVRSLARVLRALA
ncbi:4-alpha-glucanotransferase [Actinocrinis puniceicyclus]|uniref:4-alpha-glucanotransferase n=1 Tax=Actinocrinis puniceicyclus TaxID=977794 RepID=UPI001B8D5D6D|nr:4-alpha-glucanotransferase [Actinocrinis puniceicyclus]